MGRAAALAIAALLASNALAQDAAIEATTAGGEKVRLLPNGRWEYVDPVKAEPQKKAREAEVQRERNSQGGWFGIGRTIPPGDKDYNRGSLGRR
jgi:hypothetical protein